MVEAWQDMEIREEVDKVMRDVAGGKNLSQKGLPFILSEKASLDLEVLSFSLKSPGGVHDGR